jgi:hypothetical protein
MPLIATDEDAQVPADHDAIARAAYAAYGEVTGGKNHRGEPMPAYDELGEKIQQAWQAAALASRSWV